MFEPWWRWEMIFSRPEKAPPQMNRMLFTPALGRHRGHGTLHDLQERLLDPLARDIAGDRGVVRLAADLVDLVDIDDAALGPLDIVVGRLQQLEDDVFHVLADIARLGERGGVGHGEGHVEDPGQGLGQQGLAAAGRANQQDVGLGQFHVVVLGTVRQALVVIVHCNRKHPLGVILADHIVVEHAADVTRRRHAVARLDQSGLVLLADDVHAQLNAFIADEHRRAGNQLAHLVLALAAKGAVKSVLRVAAAGFAHAWLFRFPTPLNTMLDRRAAGRQWQKILTMPANFRPRIPALP
jgi:hypothetical protein